MAQAKLSNQVVLEHEIHGEPCNPKILIILGITDNITDWPPGLYEPLVAAGFCVVCYELRDSGLSSKFEHAGHTDLKSAKEKLQKGILPEAPYTAHQMVDDARLLMDHLNIDAACVIGYSYGSMVAQLMALKHPERITGLVCLQGSNYNPDLPGRTPDVEIAMIGAAMEYATIEEQIDAIKRLRIATNGSVHGLDDDEALESARTSVQRTYYPQGTERIVLSRLATPLFFEETSAITCPALILHADEDPIFNIEHGRDMANRITNAKLIVLEGAGHNHPRSLQPVIARHLVEFAATLSGNPT